MQRLIPILISFFTISCAPTASDASATKAATIKPPAPDNPAPPASNPKPSANDFRIERLLMTPSQENHAPWTSAILDDQTKSIRMFMYHLSDRNVVNALIKAADKGVSVRVILDRSSLEEKGQSSGQQAYQNLLNSKVQVRLSSPTFYITHAKAMVINDNKTFVTAMNLVGASGMMRDFGVIVDSKDIAAEVTSVFESDWANNESMKAPTPPLHESHLVWSPVNSRDKLVNLIDSAKDKGSIIATVENLADPEIVNALAEAAKRARVRVIVPGCDLMPNPLFNYPAIKVLAASGVETKVMPAPASPTQPYMHSKMIVVDGRAAYVGSVNFTTQSTTRARELGIIFDVNDPGGKEAITTISQVFDQGDWANAVAPTNPPQSCAVGEFR